MKIYTFTIWMRLGAPGPKQYKLLREVREVVPDEFDAFRAAQLVASSWNLLPGEWKSPPGARFCRPLYVIRNENTE